PKHLLLSSPKGIVCGVLNYRCRELPVRQAKTQRRCKTTQAIAHAPAKIDRWSFRYIAGRTGHFPDRTAERDDLREHLIIENEVVGISFHRQALQQLARKSAITSVIFRQLRADENIFHKR